VHGVLMMVTHIQRQAWCGVRAVGSGGGGGGHGEALTQMLYVYSIFITQAHSLSPGGCKLCYDYVTSPLTSAAVCRKSLRNLPHASCSSMCSRCCASSAVVAAPTRPAAPAPTFAPAPVYGTAQDSATGLVDVLGVKMRQMCCRGCYLGTPSDAPVNPQQAPQMLPPPPGLPRQTCNNSGPRMLQVCMQAASQPGNSAHRHQPCKSPPTPTVPHLSPHSLTHSVTHSPLAHQLKLSHLIRALTHSLTHSLTHPRTCCLLLQAVQCDLPHV
jgi:hypothetical protein